MFWYLLILLVGICLVPWTFSYDKKNGTQLHKRWWVWVLSIFLILFGFFTSVANMASDDENTQKTEHVSKKSSNKTKKKTKKKSKKKTEKPTLSKEDTIAAALEILKKNYKGTAKVTYDSDNDMFMIQPTGDDFKAELLEIIDGDEDKSEWTTLTDSIDKVSKSVYSDLDLKKTSVSLVNPDNPDKVLYTSLDGVGAYDFMDDNK